MSKRDLAELRQGQSKKRNRAKVEKQRLENEALAQAKRRRRATLLAKRAELYRSLSSKRLINWTKKITLAILLSLAAFALFWYISHPMVSREELAENLRPISVEIFEKLGAPAVPRITEGENSWRVEYVVPAGTKAYAGGRVTRVCRMTVFIDKQQYKTDLQYKFAKKSSPCRVN